MRIQDQVGRLPEPSQSVISEIYQTNSLQNWHAQRVHFTAETESYFLKSFLNEHIDNGAYYNYVSEKVIFQDVLQMFQQYEHCKACLTIERVFVTELEPSSAPVVESLLKGIKSYLKEGIHLRGTIVANEATVNLNDPFGWSPYQTRAFVGALTSILPVPLNHLKKYISRFKYEQRRIACGLQSHQSLTIQNLASFCDLFVEILRQLEAYVAAISDDGEKQSILDQEVSAMSFLYQELVRNSLIVEKQPAWPFVLNNAAHVLDAIKVISFFRQNLVTPTHMNVWIVSALDVTQSGSLVENSKKYGFTGNAGSSVAETSSVTSLVSFAFTKLRPEERPSVKGDSRLKVMERKWCLYFESSFAVNGLDVPVTVVSLPFTVTSHCSQDPLALASVLWDYAFGSEEWQGVEVPDEAQWNEVAQMISYGFKRSTGQGLNEEQLNYLQKKAYTNSELPWSDMISYDDLCKVNILGKSFTPWDWTYGALKAIQNDKISKLNELWRRGLFHGLMEREVACTRVRTGPPGTFILRFADSVIGSITYHFHTSRGLVNQADPVAFQYQLGRTPLALIVKQHANLKYLYHDECVFGPKDEVFADFYNCKALQVPSGYDKIIITLSGWE